MIKRIKTESKEEWLELRKHYIGGSDAGAVVGMNPYKSKYTLWAEKTGKIPGFEGNLTTDIGSYLEDFVADLFCKETGKKVRRENQSLVNAKYPFAIADIDRNVVGEKAGLEIKTTNSLPIMRCIRNSDEFPELYYAQCVHYLAVTGADRWYLGVLINCRDFKWYVLERDEDEINALMSAEAAFWKNNVEADKAPTPDGEENTSETISQMYPTSSAEEVDLFAYENEVKEYVALAGQIRALTAIKDEKANVIKEYMKTAQRGNLLGFVVSYASSQRRTFDSKKFAADHPYMNLDDYYTTTNVRTFKITERK